MLKISHKKEIKDLFYQKIASTKPKRFKGKTFEEHYDTNLKSKLNNYSLKDLLTGDFEKLEEIKEIIGNQKKNNKLKEFFNYDKSESKNLKPLLSKLQPKISKFFIEHTELHTCYFCNIDFINKFGRDKNSKGSFTLDHYFNKGEYPYLALSLYNLIPSCYICNSKVKRSDEITTFSPTSKKFEFDKEVKFKTFVTNEDLQIEKEEDLLLLLKEDYSDKYKEYLEILKLDDRYEYHKYKVIELIKKRRDYPDSRIKELSLITQKTEQEVKQDLFGKYLKEDLHKRPLSKLVRDISKELGLIND